MALSLPSWALRSPAALALGPALPRAPATELVFWHRVSDCAPKGCGLLFSFLFLFYLSVLSAFACSFEVTVTSVSLPPFVSRRGLSNTNQRLSLSTTAPHLCRIAVFSIKPTIFSCYPASSSKRTYSPSPLQALKLRSLPFTHLIYVASRYFQ